MHWWYIYIKEILLLPNNEVEIIYSKPWTMGIYSILLTSPHLPYFLVANYTSIINETLWKYNWNISSKAILNLTRLATSIESLTPSVDWVDGPYWMPPQYVTNLGAVAFKNPYYFKADSVWFPILNLPVETANRETTIALIEQGVMVWSWAGLPYSMYKTANSTGHILVILSPDSGGYGIQIKFTPPFNNPLVRQAFMYLLNATEVGDSYPPVYANLSLVGSGVPTGLVPWLYYQLPSSVKSLLRNYTYNVSEGFKLLEEAGWKYINGH